MSIVASEKVYVVVSLLVASMVLVGAMANFYVVKSVIDLLNSIETRGVAGWVKSSPCGASVMLYDVAGTGFNGYLAIHVGGSWYNVSVILQPGGSVEICIPGASPQDITSVYVLSDQFVSRVW